MIKVNAVILIPEAVVSVEAWSVVLYDRLETKDIASSAQQGAHYRADVINLLS